VDDDDSIISLVSISLQRDGYQIVAAHNGREALALWKSLGSGIDLVITDIEMPVMSGIEFANQLYRLHADIPILFISGSAEADTLGEKTSVNGPLHFLSKPFDLRTLREMVAGLMHPATHGARAVS